MLLLREDRDLSDIWFSTSPKLDAFRFIFNTTHGLTRLLFVVSNFLPYICTLNYLFFPMYNPRKPQFTVFKVKQDGTLLPFVMQCLDGISRSKAKAILAGGGVRVNQKNVSQHDFELRPGMVVEISKHKPRTQFQSKFVKIVYEDAQIIVIEKNIGILSMASTQGQFCVKTILDDYFPENAAEMHCARGASARSRHFRSAGLRQNDRSRANS